MPTRDARCAPKIIVRHEFTGDGAEDIQVGLSVWASFVANQIRKNVVRRAKGSEDKEGRPA